MSWSDALSDGYTTAGVLEVYFTLLLKRFNHKYINWLNNLIYYTILMYRNS